MHFFKFFCSFGRQVALSYSTFAANFKKLGLWKHYLNFC